MEKSLTIASVRSKIPALQHNLFYSTACCEFFMPDISEIWSCEYLGLILFKLVRLSCPRRPNLPWLEQPQAEEVRLSTENGFHVKSEIKFGQFFCFTSTFLKLLINRGVNNKSSDKYQIFQKTRLGREPGKCPQERLSLKFAMESYKRCSAMPVKYSNFLMNEVLYFPFIFLSYKCEHALCNNLDNWPQFECESS